MAVRRGRRQVYSLGDRSGDSRSGAAAAEVRQTDSTLSSEAMRCGSLVLSLLLLASACHGQFVTLTAGTAAAAAVGLGAAVLGGAAVGALAAGIGRRRGR